MERAQIKRGPWSVPSWRAVSVVAGEHMVGKGDGRSPIVTITLGDGPSASSMADAVAAVGEVDGRSPIYEREDGAQYLWSGLSLDLYRDLAEEYWYNLTGDNPSLYVICHESPDGEVAPFRVTADHDSATVCLESDDQVFSVPIPPEVYQHIEQFVVAHFVPQERKKRKRKNWSETTD